MYTGYTESMLDLNEYEFEILNGNMLEYLELLLINEYVNKCYEFSPMYYYTKIIYVILNEKDEKSYFRKYHF